MQGARPTVWVVALVAALLGLIGAVGPAAAGGSHTKLRLAKHADGPFEPTPQRVNIDASKSRNVYFRFTNLSNHAEDVTLTEDAYLPTGTHLSWFKGNDDISHDVQTSGFDFKLKGDRAKTFRLRITANDAAEPGCAGGKFDIGAPASSYGYFAFNASPDTICAG